MVETRTIVVDVDDTLSVHTDRDYANAQPIWSVIRKVNELYDAGWHVILMTARGMVSCNGDAELAERERGPVLKKWLWEHGVKYNELKFGKPVAVYYVDDKAMRPDEFAQMRFRRFVGGSGAKIEVLGDRVVKYAKNAKEQADWYKLAGAMVLPGFSYPKVNCCYGDTIDMEFIDGPSMNESCGPQMLENVLSGVDHFATFPARISDWQTMVDRVRGHLERNPVPNEHRFVEALTDPETHRYMEAHASFCHGDLTFENVVVRGRTVHLLDPNAPPGVYTSYLLDHAKLRQSILGYEEACSGHVSSIDKGLLHEIFVQYFAGRQNEYRAVLLCLCVHYVRMLKYKEGRLKADFVREFDRTLEAYLCF